MRTKVVAVLAILAITSVASAAVVYQDGFESGLGSYILTGTPTTSTAQVHEGSYSMMTTQSGQRARKAITATTDPIVAEYWLYDGGGSRAFMQVTAYAGGTWGGTLQQLFAIGKYNNADFGGETYNGYKYQARVTNGHGTTGSWLNLNAATAPNRSNGWHKFTIEVAPDWSKVTFKVDDQIGREVNLLASAKPADGFNWVSYGLGAGTTAETFYYDEASIISVPEPATLALLASGLFLVRRRRA